MAISLSEQWAQHTKKSGADTFVATAGQHLKVETTPQGVEILDAVVPEGKKWTVSVYVDLREEDA